MNRPCSTTPAMPASAPAKASGSGIRRKRASRMRWPPSVRYSAPAAVVRISIGPASPSRAAAAATARRVAPMPKGTTSIGNGKAPSAGTTLLRSAMTTKRPAAAATIFSRSSAPPPPLTRARPGPTSSAPSMARSSSGVSSSVVRAMPRLRACRAVRSEVGTPTTASPSATRRPRAATKASAVEPVPSPRRMPGFTSRASAASAASAFIRAASSWVTAALTDRARPSAGT